MNCQDYEAQIGDYVDGTMDEAQRASVESHLSTCASCSALVRDFSVIRAASLTLEAQVPPPHVWRKLSAAIEAGGWAPSDFHTLVTVSCTGVMIPSVGVDLQAAL